MSLFNNRELQELRAELDRAVSRADKADSDLKKLAKKSADADRKLQEAEKSVAESRVELKKARAEIERLAECRERADKAAAYYEERCESLQRAADQTRKSVEDAALIESTSKAGLAAVQAENARLASECERLSAQLESCLVAAGNDEAPKQTEGSRELMSEVDSLRRRLAECDEMRRVAVRKAEHNRRAWLVTQMQLDLAEDRICLLTTGRPRPVMETRVRVEVAEGEVLIPEDAEDVEDIDDDGTGPASVATGETTDSTPETAELTEAVDASEPDGVQVGQP